MLTSAVGLAVPGDRTTVNVGDVPVTSDELFAALDPCGRGEPDAIVCCPDRTRHQMVDRRVLLSTFGDMLSTRLDDGLRRFVEWSEAAATVGNP